MEVRVFFFQFHFSDYYSSGAAKTVQRKGKDSGDFGANYKIIPISSKYY
jgi:hypothetical protein